ncbi:MAG: ABC transporter ATP-binding protein [Acidimicrobiales bacterium]|nr:ABC transporter ATP-binding protein [Acidimicrobiales bacterium]
MTLLEALGITKRFDGICALNRVDLKVSAGELVGLIGPNGAGKTTLFNCLYGLVRPDEGRVLFKGEDITLLPVFKRARRGFGRTFQRVELFGGMTVVEHLLVAARAHARRGGVLQDLLLRGRPTATEQSEAEKVLALLGLTADADRPIEALSLGRARLVELARAIMNQPALLFLDEPFSGLDRTETAEVSEALLVAQREHGTTIMLVEHDITAVQAITQRLFVLDYGTLIAEGPTASVLKDPRVREAYLGVQA